MIRGNISRSRHWPEASDATKGVDADAADAVTGDNLSGLSHLWKEMAAGLGCIIAVTGAIDLVSDGNSTYVIPQRPAGNGSDYRNRLSAFGLMTAYLTANPDNRLEAAAAAVCAMGLAGEIGLDHLKAMEEMPHTGTGLLTRFTGWMAIHWRKGARYEIRQ